MLTAEELEAKAAAANAAPVASADDLESRINAGLKVIEGDDEDEGQAGSQELEDEQAGNSQEGEEADGAESEEEKSEEQEEQGSEERWEGVPEATQTKIEKRIGKVTKDAKEAQERAEAAEAELAEAREAADRPSEAVLDIAPEYLTNEEATTITEFQTLRAAEKWLTDNYDGYEGNGTPEDPAYEAPQIRKRFSQVQTRLREISRTAEDLIEARRKVQRADLTEGRKLRLERERLAKGGKAKTEVKIPAGTLKKTKKQVVKPKVNTSGGHGFDAKALMEKGPTRESLQSAYEAAL